MISFTSPPGSNGTTKPNGRMSKRECWAVFVRQRDSLSYTKYTILRRDGVRCRYCNCDLLADYGTWRMATIDHVQPRSRGGPDCKSNMVACCPTCNSLKGSEPTETIEEARDFINRRRAEAIARLTEVLASIGLDFPRKPCPHRIDQPAMESLANMLVERANAIATTMISATAEPVENLVPVEESEVPPCR